MATKTLGTTATTTLVAFVQGSNMTVADLATINANIKNDLINGNPLWPTAYTRAAGGAGVLYVPNRGLLQVFAGDYVAYDPNGWPILVSKNSIAGSGWSHS